MHYKDLEQCYNIKKIKDNVNYFKNYYSDNINVKVNFIIDYYFRFRLLGVSLLHHLVISFILIYRQLHLNILLDYNLPYHLKICRKMFFHMPL